MEFDKNGLVLDKLVYNSVFEHVLSSHKIDRYSNFIL